MLKILVRNHKCAPGIISFSEAKQIKLFSTQPAVQPQDASQNDFLKDFEKLSHLKIKTRTKKPQKPPFVKNLFIGVYDTDILTFPQLEKEDLDDLNKSIKPVEITFLSDVTSKSDFLEKLKNLQLTGLQASQFFGGRELTYTETCRFNEIIYNNTSLALTLINNECFGVSALLKFGNEEQQKKYIPLLTEGKMFSTFCIAEEDTSDPKFLQTAAILSDNGKHWIINGEKAWVLNGNSTDLFVVFAKTEALSSAGLKETKITAFLVEKDFPGISFKPCQGIQQSSIVYIKFENTPVPIENILGGINQGETVILNVLPDIRLGVGTACIPLTRKVLNELTNYCSHTSNGVVYLTDTEISHSKVGKIATWLYAMESTTYLTSCLMDQYENQDCEVEAAIVKVLNSDLAYKSVLEAIDLIGTPAYMKGHWLNNLHDDARAFRLLTETNNSLKLVVALLGLQFAGIKTKEKIKMIRNPLFYPTEMFKRLWTQRRQIEDNPKLVLRLEDYLHPSLLVAAQWLEYCVLRLQFATETLLSRYGADVIGKHMELERLGNSAIDVYAMTACLGRASRSYCIGLRNAETEIILATTFCLEAKERVKQNVHQIWAGPFITNDSNFTKLSMQVFKNKKYFVEHPLARNF